MQELEENLLSSQAVLDHLYRFALYLWCIVKVDTLRAVLHWHVYMTRYLILLTKIIIYPQPTHWAQYELIILSIKFLIKKLLGCLGGLGTYLVYLFC